MFEGVNKKLERAKYCLQNLRTLASDAGGYAYIPREKQQAMRANLDCFFFEIISAKDFFLQGIHDACSVTSLKRHEVKESNLIAHLPDGKAKQVVTRICSLLDGSNLRPEQKLQDDKNSWLWRLNNYRNSATHRELLPLWHDAKIDPVVVDKATFEKMQQERAKGPLVIKPRFEGEEKSIPPNVPRVDVKPENIKTYLLKDPEDPSQGKADIEVIPYCEQSLEKMTKFLKELYSQLGI
jgi:hypothetical protein